MINVEEVRVLDFKLGKPPDYKPLWNEMGAHSKIT